VPITPSPTCKSNLTSYLGLAPKSQYLLHPLLSLLPSAQSGLTLKPPAEAMWNPQLVMKDENKGTHADPIVAIEEEKHSCEGDIWKPTSKKRNYQSNTSTSSDQP